MNFFIDKITIIIVLYEEEINLILRCLESIRNYKIIIVDNAGNISLKKKIKEKFEIYKYILNKNNCGYAKAANQAIEQCDTEYILMFQADALISNKDISILLKSHKKYENCFITSPTYYDKESKLSYNSGCLPEKNSKKDKGSETLHTIPSDIKEKNITSSKGLFTGFRNLTIESAPIIPKDKAISSLITDVINSAIFGKSR